MRCGWLIVATVLISVAVVARAGTRSVNSLDGVATGEHVRIEGTLSIRGSTPLTIVVLELPERGEITLKSHDADVEMQLRSLDGLHVALEGNVVTRLDPEIPRLDVTHCDLVAPPGGGTPVNGVITIENGACVFTTDDGKRYWMVGDLAPALSQHDGARVWIVGKKGKGGNGPKPRESTAFTPTGYGVVQ